MTDLPAKKLNGNIRYRRWLDSARYHVGDGKVLIYSPTARTFETLPPLMANYLNLCDRFATLDEHTLNLSVQLNYGPMHVKAIRQQLAELVDRRVLMSEEDLLDILRRGDASERESLSDRITTLGIPTRNRPDALRNSLSSFVTCTDQPIKVYVSDQSDRQNQRKNLDVISEVRQKHKVDIVYLGEKEKQELARMLAKSTGHSLETIDFALSNPEKCPLAYGANRNALLLATINTLSMQADDDTQCRVSYPPEVTPGLVLASEWNSQPCNFPSVAELSALEETSAQDNVYALHEQLLGKTLKDCLADYGLDQIDVEHLQQSFFDRQEPRRIAVTYMGVYGNSGIGTSYYFLRRSEKERSELFKSEEHYRHVMAYHNVLRVADRLTISSSAWSSTVNIAIDNRLPLPPFMPVQRNEDGVFSHLIKLSKLGYSGYIPAMILHKRGTNHPYTSEELRNYASKTSCCVLFYLLANSCAALATRPDAASNLREIGARFVELGQAPQADFEEVVRLNLLERLSQELVAFERHLALSSGKPAFWARDVEMCATAMRDEVLKRDYVVASDLAEVFGEDESRRLLQRLLVRFGNLLLIWNDLRQAMSDLLIAGWQPELKQV